MKTLRLVRFQARSLVLILVMACSVVAGETKAPDFRLPDTARPTRYQLDLTILPDQPVFQGTAKIGVELKERTDTIWLNAKDLTVSAITVTSGEASAARWRTTDEMLAVLLAHPAGPGHVDVEIHYTGKLDEKSDVGAYRRKSGDDWYVFTSFTAIDARRASSAKTRISSLSLLAGQKPITALARNQRSVTTRCNSSCASANNPRAASPT